MPPTDSPPRGFRMFRAPSFAIPLLLILANIAVADDAPAKDDPLLGGMSYRLVGPFPGGGPPAGPRGAGAARPPFLRPPRRGGVAAPQPRAPRGGKQPRALSRGPPAGRAPRTRLRP